MGAHLLQGFSMLKEKYPIIGDVRGMGLMVAMELIVPGSDKQPDGKTAQAVLDQCLERGLIGYMAGLQGQVIRLIPPLNITVEQADEALHILDSSLATIC